MAKAFASKLGKPMNVTCFLPIAAIAMLCGWGEATATTWYVTPQGDDAAPGGGKSTRLELALQDARAGDTIQLLSPDGQIAVFHAPKSKSYALAAKGSPVARITIRGQKDNDRFLTVIEYGCLEGTRPAVGSPPSAVHLPPCPSFTPTPPWYSGATIATVSAGRTTDGQAAQQVAQYEPTDDALEMLQAAVSGTPQLGMGILKVEHQNRAVHCLELSGAEWVVIEDIHFRQCWLPAILLDGGSYITVRGNLFTGSSYAIAALRLSGDAPNHLLIERNQFVADLLKSKLDESTGACAADYASEDCAGLMWLTVPWGVVHGGTWEPYNGALFGAKGMLGSLVVRDNIIRNSYNGIRVKGVGCPSAELCSVNVEIYRNRFFEIRDNPIEIEDWGANWRVYDNDFVNAHGWISVDGAGGGPFYFFGNTGTFTMAPSAACKEADWGGQRIFDYQLNKWIDAKANEDFACGHTLGKVLKFGKQDPGSNDKPVYNIEPIYVFNNSWRLRIPIAEGGYAHALRHWNNALEFCLDSSPLCTASSPGKIVPDPDWCNTLDLQPQFAGVDPRERRAFFDCFGLRDALDPSKMTHLFDFDLSNFEFPEVLTLTHQERNAPKPVDGRIFTDAANGDFSLVSPAGYDAGCTVESRGRGVLVCRQSGATIGAFQRSGGRIAPLPYENWPFGQSPAYPERPRPTAARWQAAGAGQTELIVTFSVPIRTGRVVRAHSVRGDVSVPCTASALELSCSFTDLPASATTTAIRLDAGIYAGGRTCRGGLSAVDWAAEPATIEIAVIDLRESC
jgi:hypothetical protein